jgi:hypothetical protein
MIGEDEAGGAPSKYIGMLGAEYWGRSAWLDGTYRLHLELADTAVDFLGDSQFNVAYEHGIYTDGYRYRGRAIGHAMDNDGTSVSLGASLVRDDGTTWKALVQVADLNRDGESRRVPHTISERGAELINLEIGHTRALWRGVLDAGAGVEWREERSETSGDTRFELYAQWHMDF